MRDKSHGRSCDPDPFIPRGLHRFAINETTSPRKLARWIRRGGGVALSAPKMAKAVARHVHPRRDRARTATERVA
jgi:hypothetical protein